MKKYWLTILAIAAQTRIFATHSNSITESIECPPAPHECMNRENGDVPITATLLPIEEISSKKTLIAPLVVEKYVKENFALTEQVNTEILNIGVNDIYFVEIGSKKYVLRLSRADKKSL